MEIITLQPSPRVDHITKDGTELTQLPYPFHVDEDGSVLRQDFWQGHIHRIVGFSDRPEPGSIQVFWRDAWTNPDQVVGKYVVTSDDRDNWSVHLSAIQSATRSTLPDDSAIFDRES